MEDKKRLTDTEIAGEIESKSLEYGPEKVDEVLGKEDEIKKKSGKLNLKKFSQLFRQLTLGLEMVKDFKAKAYTAIPWRSISIIIASILYFMNPFDVLPDVFPIIGFTDDAIVMATVFKSIQEDLRKYCLWKGYDPDKYF